MASKLTKDQKREKKKREERKLKLRREHDENRHAKKVDGLLMTITHALEGLALQEELDDAVLRLGGGQSVPASEKSSRFQSPEWTEIKQQTTRMVGLIQSGAVADFAGLDLQGRLYLNGDAGTNFSSTSFPLFAMLSSNWLPHEVFQKTAKELEPEPTHGAYFFGIAVRDLAAHFALASTAHADEEAEVFYVTSKGWHRLDYKTWRDELWPSLGHVLLAQRLGTDMRSDTEYAIGGLMQLSKRAFPDEAHQRGRREPALDDGTRGIVRSFGADLLMELEVLLAAADAAGAEANQNALAYEWNEGFEARQAEINVLEDRHRALEHENQTLRRMLMNQETPPAQSTPLPTAPTRPLEERMGALLGL